VHAMALEEALDRLQNFFSLFLVPCAHGGGTDHGLDARGNSRLHVQYDEFCVWPDQGFVGDQKSEGLFGEFAAVNGQKDSHGFLQELRK
jgi:hypothetical protein